MSQIVKSSIIVTIFTVLGLGLGLLSNVIIAMKFGARTEMDVFLAATTVPFFITGILSSALSFTFIPVFAEYRAKGSEEIWKVVSSFINLGVTITAILCLVGVTFAAPIMKVLVPGFTEDKIAHTVVLFRWLLPIIVFTVVNELMAGVYYSNQRFLVPSLNKIVSPMLTMAYVWFFSESLSTKSIVLATLTAVFLQTVILAAGFLKNRDFNYSFVFDCTNPGVLKMLKLMGPLVLGMMIYRAVPIFDRYFLSRFPEGSISHIGYAMKLIGVIPPVLASGISLSLFPVMSKYAAEHDVESLKRIMSKGLGMLFFFSLPVALFLGTFGLQVIRLVFERGAFTPTDTVYVYRAFGIYLLALPAMAMGLVIAKGFYVLQDTRTVALLGVLEMIIYVSLCFILIPLLGYIAMPSSYAIYFNLGALAEGLIVRYKLGNRGGNTLLSSMVKHVLAALLSLIVIVAILGLDKGIMTVLLQIATGFILYFCLSRFVFVTDEAANLCDKITIMIRNAKSIISSHGYRAS